MALLDIFDSEQGRLGLGLLAMAQPSRMSDGERMLGALQMLDQFKAQRSAAEERKADREERARMRMLQEQQIMMQLEEARRRQAGQLDAAARRDAYLASIAGPGDGVGPTMPLDPAAALRAGLSADEQKLFNPQQQRKVKSIETLAGPNGQPVPVAVYEDGSTAILPFGAKPEPAQKPRVPDPASDLLIPGPNGTLVPNTALIDIKKQLRPPAATQSVTIDQKAEGAYRVEQAKSFSEMMTGINKAGMEAPTMLRKLDRMEQLLEGVDGGRLAPAGLELASAANAIGLKLDPRLGNKEAAQALSREIAGGFRQPGTGVMTDKDFENFLLQVPDLSKTAEGRKQIMATMRAAGNRSIAIAKLAREYVKKNGQLDNDFLDLAAQFVAENPVVAAPPSTGNTVDDLVRKYGNKGGR